jgi:Fic family protein
MPTLSPGLFRSEEVLIQSGFQIDDRTYIGPLPADLPRCLVELDEYVALPFNKDRDGLIRTLFVIYQITAVHPFRDGNSRVAQFLSELLLRQSYHLGRFPFAIRPVMARHRSQLRRLYRGIEKKSEWEPYLIFGLGMLAQAADLTAAIISDLVENQMQKMVV